MGSDANMPVVMDGNVYIGGGAPSEQAITSLVFPDLPKPALKETPEGLYLSLNEDAAWRDARKRESITSQMLGKAVIPGCAFENPDGSPFVIDTDYFGHSRDAANPFPGPFEIPVGGSQPVKVWPKP
jgi:hypothetical protein